MITKDQIIEFEKLGFELVESFHKGIYGWQVFSHSCFVLSIGYDKCYYESSITCQEAGKFNGKLINVVRKIINDEEYYKTMLDKMSRQNQMNPDTVLNIINENILKLVNYYCSN